MKKYLLVLFFISTSILFSQVKTGIEVLRDNDFKELKGKKVGLITNPTGVDSKLKSTVDILYQAKDVKLVALYGPEHGVRGDFEAGDKVENMIDEKTQVPVFSLYGATHKPTKEMLMEVDVLVYDIQDIGCRSYTYISTMGACMEAAAENNIEFVVLDRPNPINGLKIEGNLAEDGYLSFVSAFKIPYVYGLTCGELAKMLNEEGMLKGKCKLTVIPMEGWERDMKFEDTKLPWVPTSPHVPQALTSYYYVTTGIMGELGVLSEGVGYTIPFQVYGAEYLDGDVVAQRMNALGIEGVYFRPITYKPFYGKYEKKSMHGVQIHLVDYDKVNLMSLQYLFMQIHHELFPDKDIFKMSENRWGMFDKVNGTSKIREIFSKNYKYDDIKDYLNKDVESFRKLSKKYYLYD
ncbi:MAG TPA: DUF1343 domain-containing protein [Ignavibacteriaceae bacterium]|nr:DUF1343 domain-containing protein [Ignavibacteriaceae bacterium]